jgi:hypothetical protein
MSIFVDGAIFRSKTYSDLPVKTFNSQFLLVCQNGAFAVTDVKGQPISTLTKWIPDHRNLKNRSM